MNMYVNFARTYTHTHPFNLMRPTKSASIAHLSKHRSKFGTTTTNKQKIRQHR